MKRTKMKRSNYQIDINVRERPPYFSLLINLSDEFVEFAKKQEVNRESYEKIASQIIKTCGWKTFGEDYRYKVCNWWEDETGKKTGLLHYIVVPGNAAGLSLEKGINGWEYISHNLDSSNQTVAALSILTHYLKNIEGRISEE